MKLNAKVGPGVEMAFMRMACEVHEPHVKPLVWIWRNGRRRDVHWDPCLWQRRNFGSGFLGIFRLRWGDKRCLWRCLIILLCTLLGSNISPTKALLKMMFLFPRVGYVSSVQGISFQLLHFICSKSPRHFRRFLEHLWKITWAVSNTGAQWKKHPGCWRYRGLYYPVMLGL